MRIEGLSADTFWKGEVRVSGLVTDGKEQHKARIYVKGSQVYDYSCSCVAGNSYKGMCPHCEALLKEFKEREGELKKQPVSTSQGVRFMIRDYTDRAVARARGLGEERKVGLEPRLTLSGRKLKLELKVGRERKYMVRDLAAFAEAVERGRPGMERDFPSATPGRRLRRHQSRFWILCWSRPPSIKATTNSFPTPPTCLRR